MSSQSVFRRVPATLLILALTAALAPWASSSAQAQTPRPAVGAQSHAIWGGQTDEERLKSLDLLAATGATWVRLDLGWCSLEENGRGIISSWYVKRADLVVDAATARGLNVLMTLWCTPGWANGGQPRHVPPSNDADYADIARKMAAHFRGRVDAWEVWNEPNHPSFWLDGDPARYARLLRASYGAFKSGAPETPVIFGGPSHNDVTFIRKAYDAGVKGYFDAMATHPYMGIADQPPSTQPSGSKWDYTLFTYVSAVRDLMIARGDSDKSIWFTEFGWSSHDNWDGISNWQRGVTEQKQAEYLIQALEMVRQDYPYVGPVFWYNDRAKATTDVHQVGYALFRRDFDLKPVYHALRDYLTPSTPAQPGDSIAPQAPSAPDLDALSDSGDSFDDDVTSVTTPTFTGSAEPGATVRVAVDGIEKGRGVADAQGAYRVTAVSLAEGDMAVSATATDASGNASEPSGSLWLRLDTTAPSVVAPSVQFVSGAALTSRDGAHVQVRWSATDANGGVSYELQRSTDGGTTYTQVALSSPETLSATSVLAPGTRYRYRVRAVDVAGNESDHAYGRTLTVDVAQENHSSVRVSSGWTSGSLASASADAVRHAKSGGTVASFTVTGRRVAWVAQSSSNRGRAEVWLDGVKKATVDLYSSDTQPRLVQYEARIDPSVPHRFEVRVVGKRNRLSSSTRVDVDAFAVLS